MHAPPTVQGTHAPALQISFAPQLVPFAALPNSVQTATPVVQAIAPSLHAVGSVQRAPLVQAPLPGEGIVGSVAVTAPSPAPASSGGGMAAASSAVQAPMPAATPTRAATITPSLRITTTAFGYAASCKRAAAAAARPCQRRAPEWDRVPGWLVGGGRFCRCVHYARIGAGHTGRTARREAVRVGP